MKRFLIVFSILTICYACNKNEEPKIQYNDIEIEILQLVNQYRIIQKLEKLEMHETIYLEATEHTNYMINNNAISHDNFDDRTKSLNQALNASAFAENVAYGQRNAQEVVTAWLNSDGHKKNIEGDYNYTGIKASRNKNGQLFFTQIFTCIP